LAGDGEAVSFGDGGASGVGVVCGGGAVPFGNGGAICRRDDRAVVRGDGGAVPFGDGWGGGAVRFGDGGAVGAVSDGWAVSLGGRRYLRDTMVRLPQGAAGSGGLGRKLVCYASCQVSA
jgi:hypothetical protein